MQHCQNACKKRLFCKAPQSADEAYINKLENLKINPSLSTLFEIISACDCSFEDTFLQHDCYADRELLELSHACSSESKDQILRFARRRLFND